MFQKYLQLWWEAKVLRTEGHQLSGLCLAAAEKQTKWLQVAFIGTFRKLLQSYLLFPLRVTWPAAIQQRRVHQEFQ